MLRSRPTALIVSTAAIWLSALAPAAAAAGSTHSVTPSRLTATPPVPLTTTTSQTTPVATPAPTPATKLPRTGMSLLPELLTAAALLAGGLAIRGLAIRIRPILSRGREA